ncbi:MerR family transcriptional regulator [Candidatus Omnitrophota bacterium]
MTEYEGINVSGENTEYGTTVVVQRIGVSFERLRYWEKIGILQPKYVQCGTRKFRRYSEAMIKKALRIKHLVDDEKYTLQGAILKLSEKKIVEDV